MSNENNPMIPGEIKISDEPIEINEGSEPINIRVSNTGDRPVQVGSHIHFFEVNRQLAFDRKEAIGKRLNIPAGTAVRFEPGIEQEVELIEIGGEKLVYGISDLTNGSFENKDELLENANKLGFKGVE